MDQYNVPIWVTNWVVEDIPWRGKPKRFTVNGVIAKAKDNESMMHNKEGLRKALSIHFERNKKITDEILEKYKPISIEFIKQIGLGLNED